MAAVLHTCSSGAYAGAGPSQDGAAPPTPPKLPPYQDPAAYQHSASIRQLIQQHSPAKAPLHVVVCGHVDSGKSTLTGRLLHDLGYLDQRQVRKNQQGAQAAGKASFGWAWAMDEREDERVRGLTVDISTRNIETPRFAVTLLDAPGHQDFVPNMITGAAQADAALLVIDGAPGGFESGFGSKSAPSPGAPARSGQTREHVYIARSCGVKQLAVVVTKLDTCGYSQARFEEIKAQMGPFLKASGFARPLWLPVSAPQGENVYDAPRDPRLTAWWPAGASLVETIDKFEPLNRLTELPLRIVVADVISRQSLAGKVGVSGKLEAGVVATGSRVLLMPQCATAVVKEVQVQGISRQVAVAGESVDIGLDAAPPDLEPGSVLCHPEFPLHLATRFLGKVLVVDCPRPIIPGQRMVLHMHCTSSPCHILKLVEMMDSKTGKAVKRGPTFRFLLKDQVARIELELDNGVCMEVLAGTCLNRFVLRMNGMIVAIGNIQEVITA
eukprot:jgi/Ulvmu1/2943/UM149_0026.1